MLGKLTSAAGSERRSCPKAFAIFQAQAPSKSHFCTSLVIQPPAGAWDVQLAPPRVCWAVPSGPEPATRPELRAAKVLWIVGIGASPDMQGTQATYPTVPPDPCLHTLKGHFKTYVFRLFRLKPAKIQVCYSQVCRKPCRAIKRCRQPHRAYPS